MRLLLDTHALLWWFTDDERLSAKARDAISDSSNEIFASAASAWEIATKRRLGKLGGVPQATRQYAALVAADGFLHLPITHLHALRAGAYAHEHRDPFDRMLAPPRASWSRSRWSPAMRRSTPSTAARFGSRCEQADCARAAFVAPQAVLNAATWDCSVLDCSSSVRVDAASCSTSAAFC